MFIYPIYNHNGGILVLYIYITRLASNEIFSPSNKIHREVGRTKDLSSPLYFFVYLPECSNLSEDIQQQYGQVMLAVCRRYIQWYEYIAYWSAIKSDCLWLLGFSQSTS